MRPWILLRRLQGNFTRTVGRTVIDHNHFKFSVLLGPQIPKQVQDAFSAVIRGDDNADHMMRPQEFPVKAKQLTAQIARIQFGGLILLEIAADFLRNLIETKVFSAGT